LEQIKRGLICGGVWFIPLLNPDGALLVTQGIDSVEGRWRKEMLLRINGGYDFSLWKANAEAVDLNVNFDARWGTGKCNLTRPAGENYIGTKPFSARETRTLKHFTYRVCPDFTVSYHTKGEEIYWRYFQSGERLCRDFRIAAALAFETGYPLKEAKGSAGGYKDWCVQTLKIPAVTVEVGKDCFLHPLGRAEFGGTFSGACDRKDSEAWQDIKKKNLYGLQALSKAVETEMRGEGR
jgi:g-D-glutamyl-meso-diaminopimelate peptidase